MDQQDKSGEEIKKDEDVISDFYDEEKKRQMQEHENGIKKARNALSLQRFY